jgi:hypothetical protein
LYDPLTDRELEHLSEYGGAYNAQSNINRLIAELLRTRRSLAETPNADNELYDDENWPPGFYEKRHNTLWNKHADKSSGWA